MEGLTMNYIAVGRIEDDVVCLRLGDFCTHHGELLTYLISDTYVIEASWER